MKIVELPEAECRALLVRNHVARLACVRNNHPYVVPISYAHAPDERALYAFSMPGKKVDWMRDNPHVALVVEEQGLGAGRDWRSVEVEGQFEELPDQIGFKHSREHAWSLLSKHANWWEPGGLKPGQLVLADHSPHLFFRIIIHTLTGRAAFDT